MLAEFVVGSLPCSERFFSGYSGFPLSSKTNISKFQFGKDRFGFFWPEYSGSPLEVIHIFRSEYSDEICRSILINRFFALIREFGRRIWDDKSHFYWLAQFDRKMSFHFTEVFPLISDRSVWHNGKHPLSHEPLARVIAQALPVFDIKFAFTFAFTIADSLFWPRIQTIHATHRPMTCQLVKT